MAKSKTAKAILVENLDVRAGDEVHAEVVPGVSIRLFGRVVCGERKVEGAGCAAVKVNASAACAFWLHRLTTDQRRELGGLIVTRGPAADWVEDNGGCRSWLEGCVGPHLPGADLSMIRAVDCFEPVYAGLDRTFLLGDEAEYGSYNLVYFAPIASIGAKTVTFVDHGTTRRLKLGEFARRNHDFDLAKARRRNAEWMD